MKIFGLELRRSVHKAQHGYCAVPGCYNEIDDYHHKKSNSKANRKKWPLFMQSPFNCVGLCREHHDSEKIYEFSIKDEMCEVYEDWLAKGQRKDADLPEELPRRLAQE